MALLDAFANLSWVSVAVAAFAYFALGALWFAPFGFGKPWDASIGFERVPGQKWPARYYVGPFLGSLAATVATAVLVETLRLQRAEEAIALGLIVGTGYAASVSFVNAITPKIPRPFLHGAIVGSYHLVGITLAAVILTAWR